MIAVTHDGPFHADDVLAAAILELAYGGKVQVVRTRDPKIIETADIVFDVGGLYDPVTCRFDHHQRGRARKRPDGIEYSSAGLVWAHYASRVVSSAEVEKYVDEHLMTHVDAIDNGQHIFVGGEKVSSGEVVSFSGAIARLNPCWYEEQDFDSAFWTAVGLAKMVLEATIKQAQGVEMARAVVGAAFNQRERPEVLELKQFCPWQDALFEIPDNSEVLYVLFKDHAGKFMLRTVPHAKGSFGGRKPLPEKWGGLRGVDLDIMTGVEGGVFCHPGLFICGHRTRVGALALAELAINA